MNKFLNSIRDYWIHKDTAADKPVNSGYSVERSIEQVVNAVDPKMRVIPRYNKKLRKPVETTLDYLHQLVSIIPGDGDILNKNELLISLLFKDQQEQDKILGASDDLEDFLLQDRSSELSFVYFLLCMEKHEHTFLGVDQQGDILIREVQKASVSFSEHQLLAPAETPELAREGFKQCAFNGLITKIIATVMQLNYEYKQLIQKKSEIQPGLDSNNTSPSFLNPYSGQINSMLHSTESNAINERIKQIKTDIASPDSHLQQTIKILSNPQDFIRVKRTPIWVDKFGVKSDKNTDRSRYCINAAQVDIDNNYKRIAVIAGYPTEKLFQFFHQG